MELRTQYSGLLLAITAAVFIQIIDAQLNQLSPGQMFPPGQDCPDLACTLEFIPGECREIPIININGKNCTGCPRWRDSCRRTPNHSSTIQCPVINCPQLTVSKECQITEPYEYNGKRCFSCPKVNPECAGRALSTGTPCPVRACPLMFIPEECKEETTFDFMGRKCSGCPKWRSACKPTLADPFSSFPPRSPAGGVVSCPMIACDTYVPAECQVKNEYQFKGKMCSGCPKWRVGCREPERALHLTNPTVGGRVPVPSVNCPMFPCPAMEIPPNCVQQQPYEYRGKTCFRCPRWREGCVAPHTPGDHLQVISPEIPCPLIKCSPLNVPKYCQQEQVYQFNGRSCNNCPEIKPECRYLFQTSLLTDLTRVVSATDVTCPVRRCPLLYIPKECMEIEKFEFEGKSCLGCPRYKAGCVPGIPSGASQSKPNNPSQTIEVQCPQVACPMIYIPPECKTEQPYQFQGKTCYGCPKRKENCTTQHNGFMNGDNTTPPTECPVLQCTKILIPKECQFEEAYDFNGKTCFMCPKFKEGCVLNGSAIVLTNSNVSVMANLAPADPETRPFDMTEAVLPEAACPSVRCAQLNVPNECIEEQTYQLKGKICFMCPTIKSNCRSAANTLNMNTATPNCPMPKCNKMLIPQECMEIPLQIINGVECPSCPQWKSGCRPGIEQGPFKTATTSGDSIATRVLPPGAVHSPQSQPTNTLNMNTATPTCPMPKCNKMLIPQECMEIPLQMINGVECPSCPRWKPGCRPEMEQGPIKTATSSGNSIATRVLPPGAVYSPQNQPTGQSSIAPVNKNQQAPSQIKLTTTTTAVPSISGMNGILPVRRFMTAVQAVLCPRLPCPEVGIPESCKVYRAYMYNGINCPGCPMWRQNCRGDAGQQDPSMNGMIAYSLFNEMTV